jgi:hypothetical protein
MKTQTLSQPGIIKYIFFIFLTNFTFSTYAGLSIGKILDKDLYFPSEIIDGKLVFISGEISSNPTIWINDGTKEGDIELNINGNTFSATKVSKFSSNSVIFVNRNDNYRLWITDGLSASRISDQEILPHFSDLGRSINKMFFIASNGNIISTDGISSSIINLEQNISYPSDLCAFDDETFMFKARLDGDESEHLFLHNNMEITSLVSLNDLQFHIQNDGLCYYSFNQNDEKQFLFVDRYREITFIPSPLEENENIIWNSVFLLNGQVYFQLNDSTYIPDSYQSYDIYKFNPSNLSLDLVFKSSESLKPGDFLNLSVINNHIYIQYAINPCPFICGTPPPIPDEIVVLDSSFSVVNKIYAFSPTHNKMILKKINDQKVLLLQDISNRNYQQITLLNEGLTESQLNLKNVNINDIWADEKNVFAHGYDRTSFVGTLYKISESPIVSKQINGLWVSDEWQKQGLSLHTGIRPDKSEYIFASFYIYRDGKPFWVAGNVDINNGSESVTIELFEFNGTSFIPNDIGSETEQMSFGNLTITPQSCNNINALIEIEGQESIDLLMQRISNTTYDDICSD